jgi:hypothetical protein
VQAAGVAAVGWLCWSRFEYGWYTNDILLAYVFMVVVAVEYYRGLDGFKPVSLAFLVVFLNSYYWEFPIHLVSFFESMNIGGEVTQAMHLVPLLFLKDLGFRLPEKWLKWSMLFWAGVLGLTFLRMTVLPPFLGQASLQVSRVVGLWLLLKILGYPSSNLLDKK